MPTTPNSDIYPTTTFQNPLLMPIYTSTVDPVSISVQARDDWLLSALLEKLNTEIIDDIDEFKEHKELLYEIFWNIRTFGWCVVQPYQNDILRVFSSLEWVDWIKEPDPDTGKLLRVGVSVKWFDDLGNNWEDDLYFEDRTSDEGFPINKSYLFVWQKGNGRLLPNQTSFTAFALPDLSYGILTLNIQIRQILSTLTYGATNPFFYHLKYGDSITPGQRKDLITQMSFVGSSKAIGAKAGSLDEIVAIENGSVEKAIAAMNEELRYFSSITRLPLSYYLGERIQGGLNSGGGEFADVQQILRKKQSILQHILPMLSELFTDIYNTSFDNLYTFYEDKLEEIKQEKVMQNEERTEKPDQKAETK